MRKMGDRVWDPEYWRSLNPALTISDWPCAEVLTPIETPAPVVDRHVQQLREEGYLQTEPLLDEVAMARFRLGVERVSRAGFPSVFACVYDEFYQLFAGLERNLTPILGERYLMVPEGFWAFFVGADDSGAGAWLPRDHTVTRSAPIPRFSCEASRRL